VFNVIPNGKILSCVFFLCVLFAGLSSLINLYEVSISMLQEKLHLKRIPAVLVIAVLGAAVSLLIQGIVSGWMDFVSNYLCPLGAFLAGVMFFWVCGKAFVLEQVNLGARKKLGNGFFGLAKYLYCPLALAALILGGLLGGIG
jgi:NSS family neurotransmitter:Na+ symporter